MISLQAALRAADELPDRTAVVAQDVSLTRRAFADRAAALAAHLRALVATAPGADAPAAVVAAAPSAEFAVAVTALGAAGYLWVGVEPSAEPDRIRAQAAQVAPALVVVDSALSPAAADALHGSAASVLGLAELRRTPLAPAEPVAAEPTGVTLGFTSGTTGAPTLFRRRSTGRNQRVGLLTGLGVGAEDVYLSTASLAHPAGYVWAQAAMTVGATLVISTPDADAVVSAIVEHDVTVTYLSLPLLDRLLTTACARPDAPLHSLRFLLTGGRHVSRRTVARSRERLGEVLHVYYATSETGIATLATPADLAVDPLGAGHPLPEMSVLVVDPATRVAVPRGTAGQIAVAGPYTADGQELLAHAGRGHVLTSDHGVLDADGRLTVLGRRDGSGDAVLDTPTLESGLKELTGVLDGAVVTGLDTGGRVVALVEPDPDDPPEIAAIEAWLRAALHGTGRSTGVVVLPGIPYNHAGKVDVRRARAAAGAPAGR